jgi:hypothetical protein
MLDASRRIATLSVFVAACAGLAACGGAGQDGVVARVGETAIGRGAFEHWIAVMSPEPVAAERRQPRYRTLERRVLDFLISSQWLIGEARERGLAPSAREIERRYERKERESFPNGAAEFNEYAKDTGQTEADIKFDVEVELAASRLRGMVIEGEPRITQAQIAAYYSENERRYVVPAKRAIEIVEVGSQAAAKKVKKEIESGRSFASVRPLHEPITRHTFPHSRIGENLEEVIFSARPNALTGPLRLLSRWSVFKVKGITPAVQRTLAQVRTAIGRRLLAAQRRRRIAEFAATWTRRWTAMTDCAPGFVVPRCRQYKGVQPAAPEEPLAVA